MSCVLILKARYDIKKGGFFIPDASRWNDLVGKEITLQTVINEVGKKLPVTGTPALVALYAAGIGMMTVVAVKSRKKEDAI